MCIGPHKYSFAWKQNPSSARSGLFPLGEPLSWAGHFHTQFPAPAGKGLTVSSSEGICCALPEHECIQGSEHRGGLAFSWVFSVEP